VKIQPFSGTTTTGKTISGGVANVHVAVNPSVGKGKMEEEATKAAANQFGNMREQFDIVVYCQPSSGPWTGYAYINGYESFLNNEACDSVSIQVHEVGHNLGLSHSGKGDNAYQDRSGMMGISYDGDDFPAMCFNPAKSFQLGWYSDKQKTFQFTETRKRALWLNGVADYSSSSKDIVIRLEETSSPTDYYIGYNRASGM
jgi:hypothetical protein